MGHNRRGAETDLRPREERMGATVQIVGIVTADLAIDAKPVVYIS